MDTFLDGKVELHSGDCLEVLKTIPDNSLDSCCCDPPYHLTSIVKRFGKDGAAPAQFGKDGRFARASAGFMGKQWDGGDIAFRTEVWTEVLRVLKPGGHLVAFGGTRTYHRMACAIEDAGFEVRDCVQWIYGSGFPKSHDVSKGIDRAAGAEREVVRRHIQSVQERKSGYAGEDEAFGAWQYDITATDAAREWEGWGTALKPAFEPIVLARKPLSESTVAANVLKWGTGAINIDACRVSTEKAWEQDRCRCPTSVDHAENSLPPSTPATKESTAISNAAPTLSAKASNFQAGTSKMDIGCSDGTLEANISTSSSTSKSGKTSTVQCHQDTKSTTGTRTERTTIPRICNSCQRPITVPTTTSESQSGRWPANVIHDGSDEVVGAFPDAPGQQYSTGPQYDRKAEVYGKFAGVTAHEPRNDAGSAARFFYTAKADSNDRLGSKHPTVKPVDLMQWLCRLITPPKGLVLDPFAGTGTTGEAAWREGFKAVLIEREPEYQQDIRRRMTLANAGPDERSHASLKAAGKVEQDAGPLFAEPATATWDDMWSTPFYADHTGEKPSE